MSISNKAKIVYCYLPQTKAQQKTTSHIYFTRGLNVVSYTSIITCLVYPKLWFKLLGSWCATSIDFSQSCSPVSLHSRKLLHNVPCLSKIWNILIDSWYLVATSIDFESVLHSRFVEQKHSRKLLHTFIFYVGP